MIQHWLFSFLLVVLVHGYPAGRWGSRPTNLPLYAQREFGIKILSSIKDFRRDEWNALLSDRSSPFLEYDWIYAMEESGCATAAEGWQPVHIGVYESETEALKAHENPPLGKLMAVCPLYVKYNSYGEFIFDHSWADYAQRVLGVKYYPKLLSAVPFTPATGSRLLTHPSLSNRSNIRVDVGNEMNRVDMDEDEDSDDDSDVGRLARGVAEVMQQLVQDNQLSSAHVNFMRKDEISPYLRSGFQLRETIQYRWENLNRDTGLPYRDFEEYLSLFKSKRRMQIKRERRAVYEEEGIQIQTIRGDDPKATAALYQTMYEIYTTTVEKMWGQRYLSSRFFQMLHDSPAEFRHNLLFVVAFAPSKKGPDQGPDQGQNQGEDQDQSQRKQNDDTNSLELGRVVAGTINLVKGTHFYGRYWGCFAFVKHLHFEACYYKAIEYCIDHGLTYMEPGAGGGEFKYLRGFDPYLVSSVHHFRSPILGRAVGDFLRQERDRNQATADYLVANSAVAGTISLGKKVTLSAVKEEEEED